MTRTAIAGAKKSSPIRLSFCSIVRDFLGDNVVSTVFSFMYYTFPCANGQIIGYYRGAPSPKRRMVLLIAKGRLVEQCFFRLFLHLSYNLINRPIVNRDSGEDVVVEERRIQSGQSCIRFARE